MILESKDPKNPLTIAMIGVSKNLTKPSTIVMKYMKSYGYKVIPVNPRAKGEMILGEKVFGKLDEIKKKIDIVNVFRPSKEAAGIAKDVVKIDELQSKVWGYQPELETHTVETHIYRLRKKILQKFNDENFILTNKSGYEIVKKK